MPTGIKETVMIEPGPTQPAAQRESRVRPGGAALPERTAVPPGAARPARRWMQRLADDTAPADTDDALPANAARPPTGLLLLFTLIWLAATMWGAHASIVGNAADAAVALGTAASSLPVVVAASLLAGAAAGLTAAGRFATDRGPVGRLVTGLAGAALCGIIAAVVIVFGYGANASVTVLAITVGAAAVLGGAAAALPPRVLVAGIAATLLVFVVSVVINYFQSPLKDLFGAGDTVASQKAAAERFAYVQSLVCGLGAGLVAYLMLRRDRPARLWPWYLLAGALPGLILLAAEVATRLGGASLVDLVSNLSALDRSYIDYTNNARLSNALIVGFVGGIVAMIAVGRTLRRPEAEPEAEPEA